MTLRGNVLRETTPSSVAASLLKYKFKCVSFSLAQWLWYWLLVHEVTGLNRAWILYVSAMHLFICFFVTDFVRMNKHAGKNCLVYYSKRYIDDCTIRQ